MTLPALRDDALSLGDGSLTARLSLPWIRSLPLSSVLDLALTVDGEPVDDLRVDLGGRMVAPADLANETRWWFLQDRLVLRGSDPRGSGRTLERQGEHAVLVTFRLAIPYLPAGPDAPLTLPFEVRRTLAATPASAARAHAEVSRDVA